MSDQISTTAEQALAAKLACRLLFLPSSSDQILPAEAIAAFAANVPRARTVVCQTDRGHQSTSAPVGTPEFVFYECRTRDFFQEPASGPEAPRG